MWDFLRGAALSYRALFTWLNPLGYLSSRVVRPIGITVLFGSTSHYYSFPVGPTIVGASLLAGSHAVIYGMALAVGNEHNFGTMATWLASPQNILLALFQRAVPHIADGFVSGMLTYLVCSLLFQNLFYPVASFATLLVVALVSSFGLGLVVAGLNLRVRDVFLWPNIAVLAMMLFSSVLIKPGQFPAVIGHLSQGFPLSRIMSLVHERTPLSQGVSKLIAELLLAGCWMAVGTCVVQLLVRRRAQA